MYFDFADSEVAQCSWDMGRLQLRFSAARLYDAGDPRAEVVWAPVLLVAENVEPSEAVDTAVCLGRVLHGVVLYASQRSQKLPMPCTLQGVVTMELEFAQGAVMRLRCDRLSLQRLTSAHTEAFQC